ncbi:MAG TPA: hypothetical protein VFW93_09035 [Aquabacterium sp.]|uniref:hypothetical protein n=1 Tax=Aquabacterium sp. TaxID=1872578 RepID=UPI002E37EF36|nr:hypothetical protein [Aquabacterium sp.]HEX5356351.1 hypothetical protein [Aquabacterium sp.]
MILSPAFHDLRAAYQSEMDDLTSDTEGRDVLRKRLADKRKSLDFLLQMTETAPEMVAVVFHQGFRFTEPAVMDQVVSLEIDDVPDWDELRGAVQVLPSAQSLAETFLQQADGQRFMTIAAALVYLYEKPDGRVQAAADDADEEDADKDDDREHDNHDDESREYVDNDDDDDARARDEAGADWLAEQGFDRKD